MTPKQQVVLKNSITIEMPFSECLQDQWMPRPCSNESFSTQGTADASRFGASAALRSKPAERASTRSESLDLLSCKLEVVQFSRVAHWMCSINLNNMVLSEAKKQKISKNYSISCSI